MKYYSTNKQASIATLENAVVKGLAEDRGLYMPERIKKLPNDFFRNIDKLSFQEIAYTVADAFFGEDVDAESLKKIVYDTLSFDCPIVKVEENIYSLELFHGPTLAFKDVGARFMARLLQYFIKKETDDTKNFKTVNVLVATSGDTGSAVANGFLGVDGIHVYVLYPKGKVSRIQESQFTTLGKNITAIEVDGVFDGSLPENKTVWIGKPNALISKYLNGSTNLITITQNIIRKIAYPAEYKTDFNMQGKHNLGISVAKNLIYQINDPMAITKNTEKHDGSIVL